VAGSTASTGTDDALSKTIGSPGVYCEGKHGACSLVR
jgi:hypothetical protein